MNRHKVASINIRRRYLEGRKRRARRRDTPQLWAGGNYVGGAVGWVALSGRNPVIWIPMKRDPEGDEAKGKGLEQAQW